MGAAASGSGIRDWLAGLDAKTGKLLAQVHDSRARRARQRNLERQSQRLATGGGPMWVTGTYDPADEPDDLGNRQPGAGYSTPTFGRATTSSPTAPSPTIPIPAR